MAPPSIQYATTSDGVRIAFSDVGSGIPFVFIPDSLPFSNLVIQAGRPGQDEIDASLAANHRLVHYDCRGSGSSSRAAHDFSLEGFVRDIEAVADRLGLGRFVVCAGWAGGPVALACAGLHPDRVSHLVLGNTYMRAEDAMRTPEMEAVSGLIHTNWEIFTESVAHALILGWSQGEEAHELALFLRASMDPETARAAFAAVSEFDATPYVARIEAPALVYGSENMPWPRIDESRKLTAALPGARMMVVEAVEAATPVVWRAIDEMAGVRHDADAFARVQFRAAGATSSEFVAVLFTDIAGSTSLTDRSGDARAQELVRAHNAIVRDALRLAGGSETKHTGDGIMASFRSASRAIDAAIAIQRAVAEHNAREPDLPLGVRIGVNAGEPVSEDRDLFGATVQLARRVCDHAAPGQILVTEGVRHLVAGKAFLFSDRGVVSLKGFEDPVRLYEVRWRTDGG